MVVAMVAPCAAAAALSAASDGGAVLRGGGDSLGQDLGDDLVLARRKGDGELAVGSAVALGGASGPGSGASGQPNVVGLEQSLGLQPVEVELGLVPGNADCSRGLIAAYRFALGADVLIQLAAHRIRQHADPGYVPLEVSHRYSLSNTSLDVRSCRV